MTLVFYTSMLANYAVVGVLPTTMNYARVAYMFTNYSSVDGFVGEEHQRRRRMPGSESSFALE